jgi:hypothetical protein
MSSPRRDKNLNRAEMSEVDAIRSKILDNEAELAVSANAGDDDLSLAYRHCVNVWVMYYCCLRSVRTTCFLNVSSRIRSIRFVDFGCNC